MYVVYSLKMRHCRCNFLISLIIFVHFVIYSSLTFLCNFAYEIKFSIVFFKVLNNLIVFLLILFFLLNCLILIRIIDFSIYCRTFLNL